MKSEIYISTASRIKFDLFHPVAEDVNIEDIAYSLSNICRFNGHTSRFFSVAQHCLLVSHLLMQETAELMLLGLLHDAHEAYIGDITISAKQLLNIIIQGDELERALKIAKSSLDHAIYEKFQIDPPTEQESVMIKMADTSAAVIEAEEFGIQIEDDSISWWQEHGYKINDTNGAFIDDILALSGSPAYIIEGAKALYLRDFSKLMKLNR